MKNRIMVVIHYKNKPILQVLYLYNSPVGAQIPYLAHCSSPICLTLQQAAHNHISNSCTALISKEEQARCLFANAYQGGGLKGCELHLQPLIYIRERKLETQPSLNIL